MSLAAPAPWRGCSPPRPDRAPADKGDPGQPKKQAELTERIGEVNIRTLCDRLAGSAPRDPQAARLQHLCDCRAAHRMARRDDRQKSIMRSSKISMRGSGDRLFPGIRAGGKP